MSRLLPSTSLIIALVTTVAWADPATKKEEKKTAPTQAELEKQFQESLSGAVLTGTYTIDGKGDSKPQTDKYTISSVTKLVGKTWLFTSRIQYGQVDATVPIPLTVEWAGDTPVIAMTDVAVPKLGTFSCRILFHGGQYAGTWKHGDVGGVMYGTYAKPEKK